MTRCKALSFSTVLLLVACNTAPVTNNNLTVNTAPWPAASDTRVTRNTLTFSVKPGLTARVRLAETLLRVRVNHGPEVTVSTVDLPLLQQWPGVYLKVNDYDQDGMNDLAILKSVGNVGQTRCYAIYRYNPVTQRFRERKSFDRCNI